MEVERKSQMKPFRIEIALAQGENHSHLRTATPHLFPKQASQKNATCAAMVHAKQADKHHGQQEEIGDKHGDDGRYVHLEVRCIARAWFCVPGGADLWIDQFGGLSRHFENISSPR